MKNYIKRINKKISSFKSLLSFLLFFYFFTLYLQAEVPIKFTYQGNIRQQGILVNGNRTMKFHIYNSSYTTTALWTSPDYNVSVSTGVFRVILEPITMTGNDWQNNELWLEIEIEGNKLEPREQITSSIYSLDSYLLSGKKYTTSLSTPSSPNSGDLWYDSNENNLKYYNGTTWVLSSGGASVLAHHTTHEFGGSDPITNLGPHSVTGYIIASASITANAFYGDGYNLTNLNGQNIAYQSITKDKLGQSGCSVNQILGWNGSSWICLNPSASSETDPWSIKNQETLQEGATFYVSSGTVNYFIINNSFLSNGINIFKSSVSILSEYGLLTPNIKFYDNVYISSTTSSYYGGIYISTNSYINGSIYANKFIGDGSSLTGISGDNLGNHTATKTLNMNNFNIINISSATINGSGVTGNNILFEIASDTMVVLNNGNIGMGTNIPNAKLEVKGSEIQGEYVVIYNAGNKKGAWLRNK